MYLLFLFELLTICAITNFVVFINDPIQSLKRYLGLSYIPMRDENLPYFKKKIKLLFNCSYCFGYWFGMLFHTLFVLINQYNITNYITLDIIMFGFISSLMSGFFYNIINK